MFHVKTLDEYFGETVRTCARYIRASRVKSHVEDALVELLPVSGYLLNAGFIVQVPQSYRAVVGSCKPNSSRKSSPNT